jgi:hypothetical protein
MTLPPLNVCRRIAQLHAMIGSPAAKEAENAREKLVKLLAKHGCSWNDLTDIFAAIRTGDSAATNNTADDATSPPSEGTAPDASAGDINIFDLIVYLLEKYVAVSAEERIAIALWLLHTWVFDQFSHTPRLALLSPVRGCGKTLLLILIELLVAEPFRSDNVTAAVIYHHLWSRQRSTLLLDEGDNQSIFRDGTLRAVFNSGHRRGGNISRLNGGWTQKFSTFAPLAVAAIGTLPLPLLHRAVVINMQRRPADVQIERLDETNSPRAFVVAREMVRKWAATTSLNRDPEMPPQLRDRVADNWRPLLSIADALAHGEDARAAAIALCAKRPDEDAGVLLLNDIRTVFDTPVVDRITRDRLIEMLVALEDGFWAEWRGKDDDRPPHRLTGPELAQLLRPFHIRSKTVWPEQRRQGDKSARGYLRGQFEGAWARYCPRSDTPTQSSKTIHLRESEPSHG